MVNIDGAIDLLGDRALVILAAIEVLRDTPDEVWAEALRRAGRAEAAGPILNPSAWLGDAIDQHRAWRDTFVAARQLGRVARGEAR